MIRCRIKSWMFISVSLILIAAGCAHQSPRVKSDGLPQHEFTYQIPEKTADGWETASLAEVDIDSGKINEMMHDILSGNDKNIHSLLLIKNGKLVFEEYFYGYFREKLHFLASVSKSITSILIGIANDLKYTAGVDSMAYEFFFGHTGTKWIDQRYPITLKHMLTMAAGLDWDATKYSRKDPRHTTHQMYASGDPIKFVLERNLLGVPGEKFNYNSGLTILLGAVVKNTTGQYIDDFAGKYLFKPLGISNYHWDKFSGGTVHTDGGLHLRPRDMAKIGYMILKDGKWKNQQIVSKKWVENSTTRHIGARGIGYGYQWWSGNASMNNQAVEVLFASGHGGQKIFIVPKLDLVAVFTSKVFNPKGHSGPEGFLLKYIIPSMTPPIAPKKRIKLSSEILDKLVGKYRSEALDVVIPIFKKGDKLYSRTSFWDTFELIPENKTQFFGDSRNAGEIRIRFISDNEGEANQFNVHFGLRSVQFHKIKVIGKSLGVQ